MSLFQISEPDGGPRRERDPGRGIGIDLGTTHSLVALAPNGADPRCLASDAGAVLVPSVVSYAAPEPVVGARARGDALQHPQRVLSSVKRFVGRGPADVPFEHPYDIIDDDGVLRFEVGDRRPVTPVEVSAEILRTLKARAEAELGAPVSGAVITVPAYFDDAQRQATRDAGRVAGLEVYRLLAEPTAAALAYGLDRGERGNFAVYDLGGGTFDISVLRLHEGVFEVLATGGDSALGGDDFDRALAAVVRERVGLSSPTAAQLQELAAASRAAKESLSSNPSARVNLETFPTSAPVEVTRADLETAIAPLVRRTIKACRRALADAELAAEELDGVVLVGGSTRVPAVRAAVETFFGKPPLSDIDPDRVVAHGAAVQADILSGSERDGVTLLDVVPLSLGLETMGGIVEKIIPRNATIPIAARQVFTNYSEKQTGMTVHVVQGERELAGDNRSLAKFDLKGMPALPPGMARVEVTFQLDADALLTVTATELMTGTKQTVEVKPTHGLGEAEVDRLVMESLDHAAEDFDARNRAEGRVELGRVVLAVRTAYDEVGHVDGLLPESERAQLRAALEAAEAAMARDDIAAPELKQTREALEGVSEGFARRRMERALQAGMSGKSLQEIERSLAEEAELERRRASHDVEMIEGDE